ncbi:trypsin-like serine protease [Gemmatimonas groenlandica]|nr:trypsin-like serine protease [Gemmatimonas groenlandica]
MRRILASLAVAVLAGCSEHSIASSDANAPELEGPRLVKNGALDGVAHPQVGLMVAKDADGTPMWRCSGTLISPTVYLTAGHCTSGATTVEVWFTADLEAGFPGNGYPSTGEVAGTPYTHPQYNEAAFFVMDVGVVVLNAPVVAAAYGTLPDENALEALARVRGRQDQTFTAVGYGLQQANPVFVVAERIRMSASPRLVQINSGLTGAHSLLLSNNTATGGTCFGDSGGPNFVGTSLVIGGVTSFALNGNCAGTGGVFRLDRKVARDWVLSMM